MNLLNPAFILFYSIINQAAYKNHWIVLALNLVLVAVLFLFIKQKYVLENY